jgi:phosphoglycerate dehydrogenase-like enzyme
MTRVLIASYPLRNQPGPFRDHLLRHGLEPIDPEGGGIILSVEELRALLPLASAMIAGSEVLDAAVLDTAPGLRVIARTGVGYDAIDVEAATARGIAVTITPGTNQESVAEQAFALLLAVTRRVVVNDETIRSGGWDRTLPRPLRGSTLGLVGLGRIGRAMVPRARAFGMTVLGHDPLPPAEWERDAGLERASLDDLLARSDIVSLHLPVVASTRGLFDAGMFARMKPGAILINTARGGLVVENDLAAALRSGHIAGAGLDVLACEPPGPDCPLIGVPNVVISPHVAGIDSRSMEDMALLAARCIVDLLSGAWPEGCVVNAQLRDGWRRSDPAPA